MFVIFKIKASDCTNDQPDPSNSEEDISITMSLIDLKSCATCLFIVNSPERNLIVSDGKNRLSMISIWGPVFFISATKWNWNFMDPLILLCQITCLYADLSISWPNAFSSRFSLYIYVSSFTFPPNADFVTCHRTERGLCSATMCFSHSLRCSKVLRHNRQMICVSFWWTRSWCFFMFQTLVNVIPQSSQIILLSPLWKWGLGASSSSSITAAVNYSL